MLAECGGNLLLCKLLSQEIAFHIFFIGLGNSLNQGVPGNGQVLLYILRNLTLNIIA